MKRRLWCLERPSWLLKGREGPDQRDCGIWMSAETHLCVCVFLHIRVIHCSSCRVTAWEAPMSKCQQLGKLGTQGNSWNSWAQLLKEFTLQDHISQQGTFCLNWQTGERMKPLVCFVFWSGRLSVALCDQHIYMMYICACDIYMHMSPFWGHQCTLTDGWIWGCEDVAALPLVRLWDLANS